MRLLVKNIGTIVGIETAGRLPPRRGGGGGGGGGGGW